MYNSIYLCDCKINKLQQSNVSFHVNTFMNECFHEKKKKKEKKRTVFAAFQAKCPYNISTGFERNYFTSRNRCCYAENYVFLLVLFHVETLFKL